MSYSKTNWQDLPNQTTPITASRLNNMENGIANSDGAIGVNEYSTSSTYAKGDYCLHSNKLYRCITTISTAEAWNSAHWTEIKIVTEIDNTNNNIKTSLQTAEAKELTITNCAGVNGKLSIKSGETEQAEYEGKNILNSNNLTKQTLYEVTFTPVYKNNSLQYIIVNGTNNSSSAAAEYLISQFTATSGKQYTISGVTGYTPSTLQIFSYSSTAFPAGNRLQSYDGSTTRTANATETFDVKIQVGIGVTLNNIKVYPMIIEGSTVANYEPYVGGQASPNPEYSQDVVSVGSNINLLNNTATTQTINGVTFTVNSDGTILVNGTATALASITLATNPDFEGEAILSGCPDGGSDSKYFLQYSDSISISYKDYGNGIKVQHLTGANSVVVIAVRSGVTVNNLLFKPQIKKEVSGYSKYGCGSIDFKLSNGNDSTATGYKSRIVTVPLPEGMEFCKIGNYKDYPHRVGNKWYKHKEYKSEIVNSVTVNDITSQDSNTMWGLSYRATNYNSDLLGKSATIYINILSDKFKVVPLSLEAQSGICLSAYGHSDWVELRFRAPKTYTQQETADFINGTKVYYPCELVEEEITDTDTLEALYQIEHLLMYEGYTTIECLNEVKPTIQAEYLYNNEINTTTGKRFDEVEDNVHELDNRDNYSTEEQVIGRWIDGKPIYRQIFTGTTFTTGSTTKNADLKSSVNKIIKTGGQIIDTNNIKYAIPLASGNMWTRILVDASNNILKFQTDLNTNYTKYEIWVEYTKTTD